MTYEVVVVTYIVCCFSGFLFGMWLMADRPAKASDDDGSEDR